MKQQSDSSNEKKPDLPLEEKAGLQELAEAKERHLKKMVRKARSSRIDTKRIEDIVNMRLLISEAREKAGLPPARLAGEEFAADANRKTIKVLSKHEKKLFAIAKELEDGKRNCNSCSKGAVRHLRRTVNAAREKLGLQAIALPGAEYDS